MSCVSCFGSGALLIGDPTLAASVGVRRHCDVLRRCSLAGYDGVACVLHATFAWPRAVGESRIPGQDPGPFLLLADVVVILSRRASGHSYYLWSTGKT